MFDPPVRWWKVLFFLRNDADVLLPMFTSSLPISQPRWGYGVAQQYIPDCNTLNNIIRRLLRRGLMGTELH
jgi:hypothetical protein